VSPLDDAYGKILQSKAIASNRSTRNTARNHFSQESVSTPRYITDAIPASFSSDIYQHLEAGTDNASLSTAQVKEQPALLPEPSSLFNLATAGQSHVDPTCKAQKSSTTFQFNVSESPKKVGFADTLEKSSAALQEAKSTPTSTLKPRKRALEDTDVPPAKRIHAEAINSLHAQSTSTPGLDMRAIGNAGMSKSQQSITETSKHLLAQPMPVPQLKKRVHIDDTEITNSNQVDTRTERFLVRNSRSSNPFYPLTSVETSECMCCGDAHEKSSGACAPCGHIYCSKCLLIIFRLSLVDEASFPPRCCKQPFALDEIEHFLTPELINEYRKKKQEYATRDQTYCSDSRHSVLLYPATLSTQDTTDSCPQCLSVTCTICGGSEHFGECPKDGYIRKVSELAQNRGWKSCKYCGRVIQLKVRTLIIPNSLPSRLRTVY
jgi:hypothetical protein